MESERNRVCPVELANSLDSRMRRWFQDPHRILSPFVHQGMKVLDVGCGPGFFSIELAKLVGQNGKVVAADLQDGMLEILRDRIAGTELEKRVTLVKCDRDRINVTECVDFILTFYMVHEVPDKSSLFKQLYSVLDKKGQFLLVEPKLFHVSRTEFEATLKIAQGNGFVTGKAPSLLFSWSAVLTKP